MTEAAAHIELSVIVLLRNAEGYVARLIGDVVRLTDTLGLHGDAQRAHASPDGPSSSSGRGYEILALDERSRDNTLAALSLLHTRLPNLRTLQDLEPGGALERASHAARGRIWLVVDRPVDATLAAWGVHQVMSGHRAAIVPGEILVLERAFGRILLGDLTGGLVSAQELATRRLRARKEAPAWSPAPNRGLLDRALLHVRSRLSRLGLGQLDRPLVAPFRDADSPQGGGLL